MVMPLSLGGHGRQDTTLRQGQRHPGWGLDPAGGAFERHPPDGLGQIHVGQRAAVSYALRISTA
jgi:hypothetical protein